MKKRICIIALALVLLVLSSCTTAPTSQTQPPESESQENSQSNQPEESTTTKKRIIIASDIHLCHLDWNGMENSARVQKFIDDVRAEYEKEPFEALLLLGDYSLDHWKWQIKGSYLTQGVSNTKRFVEEYLSQLSDLPIEIRMIAGNHEQYGDELFFELTGHHREEIYVTGDWLFILMDTYKGDLDPTEHHDGVYTGADMEFLKVQMEAYPDKKVIICSHYLEPWKESDEFKAILRDDRVICLFCGHNHKAEVWTLDEDCGYKIEACTGNYGEATANCLWGFRELILTDTMVSSSYITPENTLTIGEETIHHYYNKSDMFWVELTK
ncbi:MAG: metallophosphoesterase [Clostridia bacterium]|nr:metallophosphoesterase [Clostridia bacterium]